MKIQLNGRTQEIPSAADLAALVSRFCKNTKNVIAEINGEIVPAGQWQSRKVADGDVVELISFVGGG